MTDTIMHKIHVWIKEGDYHDSDSFFQELYKCPNCRYENIFCGFMYCPHCGVRIKWDLAPPNKTLTSKPKKDKLKNES